MFARGVHMHLKPNSIREFEARLEKEVIPAFGNKRDSKMKSRSLHFREGSVRDQFVGPGRKRGGL